jgi:DNA-binding LytR/AlgR family response regulator
MIRTVLLDDDINSCAAAKAALALYEDVKVLDEFQNSSDFFDFLKLHSIDLVFLDIELHNEMGFDIARQLRVKFPSILIIFLTGHSTYAVDSFDFQPLYFLTKPISSDKMNIAMELVHSRMGQDEETSGSKIMFKGAGGYCVADVNDICYIERLNRKNFLVMETEEIQIAYYTMNELMDMLEDHGFFLCYQSYIISLNRLEWIGDEGHQMYYVKLRGRKEKIPVSRNYYGTLRQLLQNKLANEAKSNINRK